MSSLGPHDYLVTKIVFLENSFVFIFLLFGRARSSLWRVGTMSSTVSSGCGVRTPCVVEHGLQTLQAPLVAARGFIALPQMGA